MADVSRRFQELSPERRQLVEQLRRARSAAEPTARSEEKAHTDFHHTVTPEAGGLELEINPSRSSEEVKQNFRRFYNEVSKQLDSSLVGQFSYFLNYGYLPDGAPEYAAVKLPEKYINKNSVKLVLELIGDCDLKDRRILDVGCGRGGTIYTMQQFFRPVTMMGIDLSANAIQFCNRVHRYPGVAFREGDAERLPFADCSFDVVTNVESSHTYPNIRSFFIEAHRVLAPGGALLYTDVMPREKSNECLGMLRQVGFIVETDRDITNNVVLSCNEIASPRAQVFQAGNDGRLVNNFLAAPGSQVYEEMKSGAWIYRICRLRKGPSQPGA
jgi:phthiocerol/phenolphthiocerol synthesis type-I polyketide synthase E